MTYYLLVEKTEGAEWAIQFGDSDKEAIEFERDDYADHGIPKKNLKVIKSASSQQRDCDAAVAKLNEKEAR